MIRERTQEGSNISDNKLSSVMSKDASATGDIVEGLPRGSEEQEDSNANIPMEAVQSEGLRAGLQGKADELFTPGIRRLNILDLPTDVIREICDHLRLKVWRWKEERLDYQNMRQVCRAFSEIASPLLFRKLHISLDPTALNLAKCICSSPLLASGVEEVIVQLNYRPAELANDLTRFAKLRLEELRELDSAIDYHLETWYLGDHDYDDETVCELPYRVYGEASEIYGAIRAAWTALADGQAPIEYEFPHEMTDYEQDITDYQEMLLSAFDEYSQMHKAQLCLADGQFADEVASLISQLPQPVSVIFEDLGDHTFWDTFVYPDPTVCALGEGHIPKWLVTSQDWRKIENVHGGAEITAAKVLWQLPIACAKLGAPLSGIEIACFPLTNNYAMLAPTSLVDLQDACRKLETFDFGGRGLNNMPLRYEHIRSEEKRYIDDYLEAMLSSRVLKRFKLNLRVLGINDGRTNREGQYHIGQVLNCCDGRRLRRFSISNASFAQAELEKFCGALGGDVGCLSLNTIDVTSGSWAHTLDILRERTLLGHKSGVCSCRLSSLRGGEFGRPEAKEQHIMDSFSLDWGAHEKKARPDLVVLAEKYISGGTAVNPLGSRPDGNQ